MPFDSEGVFTRIHNWEDDRINDIEIVSDSHDEEDDNFATGLSQTVLRDGRAAMTGNLNMAQFQIRNLKDGTSATDAVNKTQMDTAILTSVLSGLSSTVFVGDFKMSMQAANHGNWLLCNGQAVSRTDYADLFALIGTTFGKGDGSTTFNVPDFAGRVGQGKTSSQTLGQVLEAGLPSIAHTHKMAQAASDSGFGWPGVGDKGSGYITTETNSAVSEIYGKSNTVQPPAITVNFFIRAKDESEVS